MPILNRSAFGIEMNQRRILICNRYHRAEKDRLPEFKSPALLDADTGPFFDR